MKPIWRLCILVASIAAPAELGLAQGAVQVEVDRLGVGNLARVGDIAALRVKLTSDAPRQVWVQWQMPNVDGDVAEHWRSIGLTANQGRYVWLYAPLPPQTGPDTVWTVRAFEDEDGQRRGELGGTRFSPDSAQSQLLDLAVNALLVVGERRMGWDDFAVQAGGRSPRPVGAHEDTRITNTEPTDLPDRWFGLSMFEAIGWVGDSARPGDLAIDQADAIREYVRRGGHLVISLPDAGNPWGLGVAGQTLLEDLLPCRTAGAVPRRDDAVKLETLLPTLSKYSSVRSLIGSRTQPEFAVRVFKDLRGEFNVIDNHYEPLITLPDGRIIAVQRLFGHGRVTVIGLDLSDGRLAGLGLPQGDAFWNRVLGRRADTPTAAELNAISKGEMLSRADSHDRNLGSGPLFSNQINMSESAGAGLLLALILFVSYWLIAGPVGFAVLKHYGQVKHAWLAFAACAALFTALAWSSVELVPKPMKVRHVTFLDHIARPAHDPRPEEEQYQRAVGYLSVYLPDYGSTEVRLDSLDDRPDVLTTWIPPGEVQQPFPNVDRYTVDVGRSFNAMRLPSRSTATTLYANWLGGVDPSWGGMLRADPNNPIKVVTDGSGGEQSLSGRIINDLPGTLTNVSIIWIKNNRVKFRGYAFSGATVHPWVSPLQSGWVLNTGNMWRLDAQSPLVAGNAIDLSALTPLGSIQLDIDRRYIAPYVDQNLGGAISTAIDSRDRTNYIEMLSFFQQLTPPKYLRDNDQDVPTVSFHRELGRELDLSPWFTRPCIIVIGFLEKSATPLPLRVGGSSEPPVSDGLTVVRWVYPLPVLEDVAFASDLAAERSSEAASPETN